MKILSLFSYAVDNGKWYVWSFLDGIPDIQVLRLYEYSHSDFPKVVTLSNKAWRSVYVGSFS
ncbi:hypothetical protein Lalb_Chr06g0172861 [Lupinus albus]|uniref:Uncharacterized protein n=1 Tax=Lupinus albus TaxID=3870 RepID=A0A6A4QEE1_LUPAL|nr:hypothetical protein Lalb_Chr06g0172861 [Lupinus albus]